MGLAHEIKFAHHVSLPCLTSDFTEIKFALGKATEQFSTIRVLHPQPPGWLGYPGAVWHVRWLVQRARAVWGQFLVGETGQLSTTVASTRSPHESQPDDSKRR